MEKKKKNIQMKALNPMVLLAIIIIVCAIATYLVPAGQYDRVLDPVTEREIVDPNTFHYVEQNPVGLFPLFKSVTLGLQRASYVIFFLFIIGGMFQIMEATGAIHNGMTLVVKKMAGKELLMIPVCMMVFGCGSAFAGNFEEFLAFVPLVLAVCLAMGFDSLVALGIIFCSAASGYAGAMTNAFTVGVAQGIAGLPMFSGIGFRACVFLALMAVSITYVTLYARKIKKNPQASLVYEFDKGKESDIDLTEEVKLTFRQKLVLLTFFRGYDSYGSWYSEVWILHRRIGSTIFDCRYSGWSFWGIETRTDCRGIPKRLRKSALCGCYDWTLQCSADCFGRR